MTESYASRKRAVLRQVGAVKRSLNSLNGQLEQVRREAVRLGSRKTPITPDQLVRLSQEWSDVIKALNATSGQIQQLNVIAASYL